jgi:hypothetical protein
MRLRIIMPITRWVTAGSSPQRPAGRSRRSSRAGRWSRDLLPVDEPSHVGPRNLDALARRLDQAVGRRECNTS